MIAVDESPSMTKAARERLGPAVEVLTLDLLELDLDEPVDAVFSTATFHWIADHERLFWRLHGTLRPGGRLVAQCGGEGNITVLLRRSCRSWAASPTRSTSRASARPGTTPPPRRPRSAYEGRGSLRCVAG